MQILLAKFFLIMIYKIEFKKKIEKNIFHDFWLFSCCIKILIKDGKPLLSSVVSLQNEHSISVLMSLFEEYGACNLDLCRMDPVEGKNIFHYAIQNTSSDKFMCDFQTDRGIFSQIPSRSEAKSAFVAQKILKLVHEHDPEAFHHMLCQQSKQGHTPLVQAVICMNFEAARTILQMTVETSTRNKMVSIR